MANQKLEMPWKYIHYFVKRQLSFMKANLIVHVGQHCMVGPCDFMYQSNSETLECLFL